MRQESIRQGIYLFTGQRKILKVSMNIAADGSLHNTDHLILKVLSSYR